MLAAGGAAIQPGPGTAQHSRREFSARPKPSALVERYGLAGRKVLLTVSRLSDAEKYKGHDRVIHGAAEGPRAAPGGALSHRRDGDDEPRLRALVGRMSLASTCTLPAASPGQSSSITPALPTCRDALDGRGIRHRILEAAASGCTFIGGNADGSLDALREGRSARPSIPWTWGDTTAVCRAPDAPRGRSRARGCVLGANFSSHVAALAGEIAP